jgi:hypothetical protein
MEDRTLNLIARIQHFYDYMNQRKSDLTEEIIVKNPEVVKHLNAAYEDLQDEFLSSFKEFIYQK